MASRRQARAQRSDGGVRVVLEGIHPVTEALRARRRAMHELRLRPDRRGHEVEVLRALAQEAGVAVSEKLEARSTDPHSSQGVQLEVGPLPEYPLESLVGRGTSPRTLIALDGVEDPQNLGAIARAANGSGAAGLILTARRAPPLGAAVSRASAGAIEWLAVARVGNLARSLDLLKGEGYWVFGAQVESATSIYEIPERWLESDRVVVLGSEGKGLRSGVASRVDHPVRIPMWGEIESLNVGSAAAVLLYELARRSRAAARG